MSRYGNSPITLPKGVEVKESQGEVVVKGPKGELKLKLLPGLMLKPGEQKVVVLKDEGAHLPSALQGLYRSLINNMVVGVAKGFEKRLSMVGVGFRAAVQGSMLDLQIGFSHPTKIAIPKELKVEVEKSTLIKIFGIDKRLVGQFAADVRSKKPPEPYKGKGIRHEEEKVRKKAGKAAKSKTA